MCPWSNPSSWATTWRQVTARFCLLSKTSTSHDTFNTVKGWHVYSTFLFYLNFILLHDLFKFYIMKEGYNIPDIMPSYVTPMSKYHLHYIFIFLFCRSKMSQPLHPFCWEIWPLSPFACWNTPLWAFLLSLCSLHWRQIPAKSNLRHTDRRKHNNTVILQAALSVQSSEITQCAHRERGRTQYTVFLLIIKSCVAW